MRRGEICNGLITKRHIGFVSDHPARGALEESWSPIVTRIQRGSKTVFNKCFESETLVNDKKRFMTVGKFVVTGRLLTKQLVYYGIREQSNAHKNFEGIQIYA